MPGKELEHCRNIAVPMTGMCEGGKDNNTYITIYFVTTTEQLKMRLSIPLLHLGFTTVG